MDNEVIDAGLNKAERVVQLLVLGPVFFRALATSKINWNNSRPE